MREGRAGAAGTPWGLQPAPGGARGEPATTFAWWEVSAETELPPGWGGAAASAKAALLPLQREERLGSESAQAALIPSGRLSSVTPQLRGRSADAGGSEGPTQRRVSLNPESGPDSGNKYRERQERGTTAQMGASV